MTLDQIREILLAPSLFRQMSGLSGLSGRSGQVRSGQARYQVQVSSISLNHPAPSGLIGPPSVD